MSGRIARRFAELARAGRAGLITFVTAGDPDMETSEEIVASLPLMGADLIEIGVPFSDPMADGPAIQEANLRALGAGATLAGVIGLVRRLRARDDHTPVVLMGYYNPILAFGVEAFVEEAAAAGIDGLIVVDLPPEEDAELRRPAKARGLDIIRLATPTTDDARLPKVLDGASGFLYHVAVAGITGTRSAAEETVERAVARLKRATDLPVAVGFGIKTPEDAAALARHADAVVVGSALVREVAAALDDGGDPVARVSALAKRLADAVHAAREEGAEGR
ncbi:MAG: tryptophan synthase subunit alpha [Alphaproteobacteria bacterium]|nr:MAG: tryptophan synthase subunit alpha [Alphaproteobacteria bacterium]